MDPLKHPIRFKNVLLIFLMVTFSCDYQDFSPDRPVKGDYFPMVPGSTWTYVKEYFCQWPDSRVVCSDTLTYMAKGDKAWLENYEALSTVYGTAKWIKTEGSQYFTMGAYEPEYMFLDTGKPLHGSWTVEGFGKSVFTVIEVNATKTVKGVTYRHVIGMLESYFTWNSTINDYEEILRSYHYYAKDVGEIYYNYPDSPFRSGGATKVSVIAYTRP